ncbi:MAG: hypothetical protein WA081_09670 [Desulfosalsimonadaceae bacterium]
MIPAIKPNPSEAIADWIVQHSDEIETAYGIYLDKSIAGLIIQTFNTIFESMAYQTKLIRKNEEA